MTAKTLCPHGKGSGESSPSNGIKAAWKIMIFDYCFLESQGLLKKKNQQTIYGICICVNVTTVFWKAEGEVYYLCTKLRNPAVTQWQG